MVIDNKTPNSKWVNAIQIPPIRIQIMFPSMFIGYNLEHKRSENDDYSSRKAI